MQLAQRHLSQTPDSYKSCCWITPCSPPTPRLDCRGRRGDAGGNGAKSLGFYIVSQAANAPQNAINLALLSSGLLKIVVVGGVWSVNTLTGAVTLTTTNVALALRYHFTSIRL
jgi:hypothetical protein